MHYTIYRAPGWHGEPTDPVIGHVETERQAALMAGERVDIRMPGGSNPHDCYAVDEDGELVDPIESFRCGACGELTEWGDGEEGGPTGTQDGQVLPCPGAVESHTVTWVCEDCAVDDYCWRLVQGDCPCDRCA